MPLGNYTPIKATTFNTNFELGVTRAQTSSPNPISKIQNNGSPLKTNSLHGTKQQKHTQKSYDNKLHSPTTNGTSKLASQKFIHEEQLMQQKQQQQQQQHQQSKTSPLMNNGTGNGPPSLLNGQNGEPESLQYLKPASDDQTVAWSEGASDLLF